MAEFIMKKMIFERGLSEEFLIESSATSTEEIWGGVGNPIYPPAKAELKRRGIPFSNRRAARLTRDDYSKYDMLVCMDRRNIREALSLLGSDPEGKLSLLLDYTDEGRDVLDPWYSERFDVAFDDIYRGCESLLKKILDV